MPDLHADFHGRKLADVVMEPTRIYVKPLLALMAATTVKGMAHITGCGNVENVPRVLPQGVKASIRKFAWPLPPLFAWLQREGGVAEAEMHRVFNCGIGMVVIVSAPEANAARALLEAQGETVFVLGEIAARGARQAQVEMLA